MSSERRATYVLLELQFFALLPELQLVGRLQLSIVARTLEDLVELEIVLRRTRERAMKECDLGLNFEKIGWRNDFDIFNPLDRCSRISSSSTQ